MRQRLSNIYRLGIKEMWSLWRDPIMLGLSVAVFTFAVYLPARTMPETLYLAPIAIVDEDDSALSGRIASAFYGPYFATPVRIANPEVDPGLDAGTYTFVLTIPPQFQRDVLRGASPRVQLNIDATRMTQAFLGNAYVQQIVMGEVTEFIQRYRGGAALPVELTVRARFNPGLTPLWFGALLQLISGVTTLSIILTGAALIREREHGTIEHLLVMPVTPTEIMLGKVWAMGLVVLVSATLSLQFVIRGALRVPVEGSIALFLVGVSLHLFATTSMGIFLATVARSMPQFGLLMMMVLLPLEMLSGGLTPREGMPDLVRNLMLLAPTTHFTELGQAILYRGAGLDVVWRSFAALFVIGSALFALSLARFRRTIGQMA